MRNNKDVLILIGVILFFVSGNLVWFKMDQVPPMWDQAVYLKESLILYDKLTNEGLVSFCNAFTHAIKIKAPLIAVMPVPFYLLFGKGYISALCVNLLFIFINSYYLYNLGAIISGRRVALLSVLILNLFPLVFGMSREFLVEYGLMTLVVMWFYYLLRSDCFENRKYSLVLGIVSGLGMLMKVSFPLYVIAPALFLCIKSVIKQKKLSGVSIVNFLMALIAGTLLAGVWYLKNFSYVMDFALTSGYGQVAEKYQMGAVFSLETILKYWLFIINYGISTYMFLVIGCLIIIWGVAYLAKRTAASLEKDYFYFLLIWFAVPFVVYTFGVNKDYRYITPVCPSIALLMSIGLTHIPFIKLNTPQSLLRVPCGVGVQGVGAKRRPLPTARGLIPRARSTERSEAFIKYRKILQVFLVILPIINYLFISFYMKPVSLETKHFVLLDNNLSYTHPPRKEKWPNERLIDFIRIDAIRTGISPQSVETTLLFDHNYMNDSTQNYYSKKEGAGINFITNDYYSNESIAETVDKIENKSSYIVTKSDNLGPDFSNVKNIPIIERLNGGKLHFEKIGVIPLPDETFLTIYRNRDIKNNSAVEILKDYNSHAQKLVNFSGKIRLLNSELERNKNEYRMTFSWECLGNMDRNYRIFVHIFDSHNDSILNLDHLPLGAYPTSKWKKGEIIKDKLRFTMYPDKNFQVYIGVYEEDNGSRLLVKDKIENDDENIKGFRIY